MCVAMFKFVCVFLGCRLNYFSCHFCCYFINFRLFIEMTGALLTLDVVFMT